MNIAIKQKKDGFSLIELMIAISLGLLITWGVIQIFSQNKSLYLIQQLESNINENIRLSKNIFAKEIRETGYLGCNSLMNIIPNITATSLALSQIKPDFIVGYAGTADGVWSPQLPTALVGKVKSKTDALTIRKASSLNTTLSSNMQNSSSDIVINPSTFSIKQNDPLIISDCKHADIFKVSSIVNQNTIKHIQPENSSPSILKAYISGAQIARFENTTYYLKNTGRVNNSNNAIYALYSMDSNGKETELIEGIENLKFEYKAYQNSVYSYYAANDIESNGLWDKIVAVKLNITLNSINTIFHDGSNDVIKKTISIIVFLRNQLP